MDQRCDWSGSLVVMRVLVFPFYANSPRNVKSVPESGGGQWSALLSSAHLVVLCLWKGSLVQPGSTSSLALTLEGKWHSQRAADAECELVAP